MLSPKMMMFFGGSFFIGTFLCLTMEGGYFGQTDIDIFNALTGYNYLQVSGSGLWVIPKLAIGFFTTGFPKLIMWDYSFFEGSGYSFIRIMLIVILSTGLVWGITQIFITAVQGIFAAVT